MPTMTRPVAELERAATETRQHEIAEAKERVAFHKGEAEYWDGIARALTNKPGPSRARAGNGAKSTTRRRPARARARTRAPSGTLTAPMVIRAMRSGLDQTSQIAKSLHSTPTTIQRWMAKLEKDGMVAKFGSGAKTRWALTDKGMRAGP